MSHPTPLALHLSTSQLEQNYKTCSNALEARRWHFLLLMSLGNTAPQAARLVRMSQTGAHKLLNRYNDQGPKSVADGRLQPRTNRGRAPALTPELFKELMKAVRAPHPEGSLWTGAEVARWIEEKTGKQVWAQLGCVYLNRIKATPQVPRPQHKNAKPKRQARFKKTSSPK